MHETRVLVLRHAETAAPTLFHGAESDVGLGERGLRQAVAVAAHLAAMRPDAVASSTMRRAIQTATPIAEACGVPPETIPGLHERRMATLSGASRAENWHLYQEAVARWAGGDLDFTHPGGETYAEIRARVVPAFLDFAARHAGETAVLVVHGIVIRVLLTSILADIGPVDFERVGIDFVAINDLRNDGDAWRAVDRNFTTPGVAEA